MLTVNCFHPRTVTKFIDGVHYVLLQEMFAFIRYDKTVS